MNPRHSKITDEQKEAYRKDLIKRAVEHAKRTAIEGKKNSGFFCSNCKKEMSASEVFFSSNCFKCNQRIF